MLRIALAQTPGVRLDQWRETLLLVDELIQHAIRQKADLVLLPECVWPAYYLGSKEAYLAARAAGMPGPAAFLDHLQKWAPQIAICAGYIAENEGRLYNAACFIGRDGPARGDRRILGTHHKCFLWDFDRQWFESGQRIEPFDTEFGKIGIMICADNRLPEIPATLAARGAQLILQPTAWVNAADQPGELWSPQADFLVSARAREFGIPIASASKWGIEGETTFVGSSLVCDAAGNKIIQANQRETTVITTAVELSQPQKPQLTPSQKTVLLAETRQMEPAAREPFHIAVGLIPQFTQSTQRQEFINKLPRASETEKSPLQATLWLEPPNTISPDISHNYLLENGIAILSHPKANDLCRCGAVRFAAVRTEDTNHFAPLRTLALQGAHVIVVIGDTAHLNSLKARAMENRIFLLWSSSAGVGIIDPRGWLVASYPWPAAEQNHPTRFILDLASATVKEIAWRTDIFADRQPSHYVLTA